MPVRRQHPAADHEAEAIVFYELPHPAAVAGLDARHGCFATTAIPGIIGCGPYGGTQVLTDVSIDRVHDIRQAAAH